MVLQYDAIVATERAGYVLYRALVKIIFIVRGTVPGLYFTSVTTLS